MMDEWASLRRQLGAEYGYRRGHWFCVPHEAARVRADGYAFSRKEGGDGRRVVLATSYGPNATLFARSASREAPFVHPAHTHDSGPCKLDQDGWINFRIRVVVDCDVLCDETYSCEEPSGSPLLPVIERMLRL